MRFGGKLFIVTAGLALAAPLAARASKREAPRTKPAPTSKPAPAPKPTHVDEPPPPAPPAASPEFPVDPRKLGIAAAAIVAVLLVLAKVTAKRASRQPLKVEVVLDSGMEGRFHAALLPAEGEAVAAAIDAALQTSSPEVLDPPLDTLPMPVKKLLADAVRVQHVTQLSLLSPGPYRVVAWGRSAPSRELSLRVGGATAARTASGVRTHVQERRVQLLEQPLTVHFDFRQARPRGAPGGDGRGVTSGSMPAAPAGPDPKIVELQRRAREAFSAGRYDEAAAAFRELGDREQEARCYLFGGAPEKVARIDAEQAEARGEKTLAVNHYLRAGDRPAATRLLRELGREAEALHLEAKAKLDAGDRAGAIALFERAGDARRAGELLEASGDTGRAMEAYQRAGAWEQAGRLAAKQGDLDLAARAFEKAGRHAEASVLRLKLGQADAARALAEQARPGAPSELLAITVLARVYQAAGRVAELPGLAKRAAGAPLRGEMDREALRALGAFAVQLAQREAAQIVYQRLVDTDPVDLEAADALKAIAQPAAPVRAYGDTMAVLDQRATQGVVSRAELQAAAARAPTAQSKVVPPAAPALPQGNDRYRIDAEIGRGAMGVVYRATDQLLGREVALKMLAPEFSKNEQLRRLFLDEARALAALNHPHVVQVYDLGDMQGSLFLAMELVTGETLEQVLARTPLLPLPRALALLRELAGALEAAHGRRIVHRDVKPANVMITPGDVVKLMDFGIATGGGQQNGMVMGTPRYMAPEQIRGETADARADLYAFGVVAFEVLSGTLPFPDEGLLQHHLNTPAPSLASRRADLPPLLVQLVARLLAKSRDERPASAAELQAALAAELPKAG